MSDRAPCLLCGGEGCPYCQGGAAGVPDWMGSGGTATQRARAARGIHPTGRLLLDDPPVGAQCGTCRHCEAVQHHARRYTKCLLARITRGPGSDIRRRWAPCDRWEPREVSDV